MEVDERRYIIYIYIRCCNHIYIKHSGAVAVNIIIIIYIQYIYIGSSGLIPIPARAFGNTLKNIPIIIIPAVYRKEDGSEDEEEKRPYPPQPSPTFHLAKIRKYIYNMCSIIHALFVQARYTIYIHIFMYCYYNT